MGPDGWLGMPHVNARHVPDLPLKLPTRSTTRAASTFRTIRGDSSLTNGARTVTPRLSGQLICKGGGLPPVATAAVSQPEPGAFRAIQYRPDGVTKLTRASSGIEYKFTSLTNCARY
jgi:hypothetical protein